MPTSPSVRHLARELGVDLTKIKQGSGRKGRILKEDVQAFIKQTLDKVHSDTVQTGNGIPPIPEIDFSKFGQIEEKPLNKIKRLTGTEMSRNWLNLPMVTHHDEADIIELEAFRKSLQCEAERKEIKITSLVFIMKALATALKLFSQFNTSLSANGEHLIYKNIIISGSL